MTKKRMRVYEKDWKQISQLFYSEQIKKEMNPFIHVLPCIILSTQVMEPA